MNRIFDNQARRRSRQKGGILILCTVLAGLGTMGVVAWVSLLQARTIEAETQEDATERFIRIQNGRALAREVLYRKYVAAASGPTATEAYELPEGWGYLKIENWDTSALSDTTSVRTNKSGSVPFRAFSTDVMVGIVEGDVTHAYQHQIKSYNPMLGGNLLTVQRATVNDDTPLEISGDLRIHGRALFWGDDYSTNTFSAITDQAQISDDQLPNLAFTNNDNNNILPSNFPFPAATSGVVNGAVNYSGQASVIVNDATPENSYVSKARASSAYEVAGNTAFVETDAPATNATTVDDTVLIAIINQDPAPADDALEAALATYHPLSSIVLTTLLNRSTPAISSTSLRTMFLASSPLPRDVLTLIAQDTLRMTAADKLAVFDANPIGIMSDGAGTITIDLDQNSASHVVATDGITNIIFKGQTSDANYSIAGYMNPLIFTFQNTTTAPTPASIANIEFRDRNNRRAIFAFHQAATPFPTTAISFTGATPFPQWRGLIEMEGIVASMDSSAVGSVSIKGGIRTDHSLGVSAGIVNLIQETELTTLEELASRNAWVESYDSQTTTTPTAP